MSALTPEARQRIDNALSDASCADCFAPVGKTMSGCDVRAKVSARDLRALLADADRSKRIAREQQERADAERDHASAMTVEVVRLTAVASYAAHRTHCRARAEEGDPEYRPCTCGLDGARRVSS